MVDSCKIFSSSSGALKACTLVLGVVFIIQCVGIGTDHWVQSNISYSRFHMGLWKYCYCYSYNSYSSYNDDSCLCISFDAEGWLKAVRALEVIGLIAIIIVGFMIFCQLFFTQSLAIKGWGIVLMFFAGVCILSGVILYGAKMMNNMHYSFGLCVTASILCFLCGCLLGHDRRISLRNAQTPGQVHYTNQGQIIHSPQAQVVVAYTNQPQQPVYPPTYTNDPYGQPPPYSVVIQQQGQFTQPQGQFTQPQGQFTHPQGQFTQQQQPKNF